MKRALATVLAFAAAGGVAAPALSQEVHVLPPPPPPVEPYPAHQGEYEAEPGAPPLPTAPVMHSGVHPAPTVPYAAAAVAYPAPGAAAPYHDPYAAPGLPPLPTLGYTEAERDAWLADCRAQYYGEGRRRGGVIGGLLGAVGGGILGHEVTGGSRTRRIGGTLIGAGVGGLAGLAIGAAIGAAGDEERIDECEAYLRHYAGGYSGYGYGYHGYTTVMVPVQVRTAYAYSAPVRREHSEVIAEVVEETVEAPREPVKYVRTAPVSKYAK